MNNQFHTPVLVHELFDNITIRPGTRYIDATLGGGGHAFEIVKRGGFVLGIDADKEAIDEVWKKLSKDNRSKMTLAWGNFGDIEAIAKANGFLRVGGVLFDLGVSSHEIDTPQRGFSYRFSDMDLDLRFDQSQGITAGEVLKNSSEEELYEIFTEYSEEKLGRVIARAIIIARRVTPIRKTGDLIKIVEPIVGDKRELVGTLSRIFQGLRIVVNDEFGELKNALVGSLSILGPGGFLAVISFHSLEDRIVKLMMKTSDSLRILTKKPIVPSDEEILENRRSRSAKLRIAVKI